MFNLLFGWRKASKCKKLIRNVQCRLKLLKNKRRCIVKRLRADVAQLLKHGHRLAAFDRVEQVVKDESMADIYDLLDSYCEFVMINFRYIRKHKDCPNDINEAVSTLIFSSARFGELPELLSVRKLFGEIYGQRFVTTALELRNGNLVNLQIAETLYMKDVSSDVKYKLLDEIASTSVEPGPLLLEYHPFLGEKQAIKRSSSPSRISSNDVADEEITENADVASECMKSSEDPCNGLAKENNLQIVLQKNVKPSENSEVFQFQIGDEPLLLREDSASESSAQLPEEMVYLDYIEEFVLPVTKEGNLQDQRVFRFRSFSIPTKEVGVKNYNNQEAIARNSGKMRKTGNNRSRSKTMSQENVVNFESAIYYSDTDCQRKRRTKSLVKESHSATRDIVRTCNDKGTEEEKNRATYSRAISMPNERGNESSGDNIFRSKSFPLEHPRDRHIHPKMPDYDELAAKFIELKKANLKIKQQDSDQ